jgi:uncharacterized DUF497 family protein
MLFTWDERKRLSNVAKHGLDFAMFEARFGFSGAVVVPAKRGRSMMIGSLDGVIVAVVFAKLGSEAMTLISLRRASRKERSLYE